MTRQTGVLFVPKIDDPCRRLAMHSPEKEYPMDCEVSGIKLSLTRTEMNELTTRMQSHNQCRRAAFLADKFDVLKQLFATGKKKMADYDVSMQPVVDEMCQAICSARQFTQMAAAEIVARRQDKEKSEAHSLDLEKKMGNIK